MHCQNKWTKETVKEVSSLQPWTLQLKQLNKRPLAKPCGQSDAVFLVSRESIRIWYIFRLAFRLLFDVSYSDECRTKTVLSVCEKNVSAFSCNSEVLQYQQIIHLLKKSTILRSQGKIIWNSCVSNYVCQATSLILQKSCVRTFWWENCFLFRFASKPYRSNSLQHLERLNQSFRYRMSSFSFRLLSKKHRTFADTPEQFAL